MDGWLAGVRWRRRGAWLWPLFIALIAVDAVIGHAVPPQGESQSLVGAALLGCVLNLLAVLLLSRPLAALLRSRRRELPSFVARDYAGRVAILAVTAALLAAGLIHRPALIAQRRAMDDAISRAQAFIGDWAPAAFRRDLAYVSTYAIEPGRIYRTCVPNAARTETYCVIVDERQPFSSSVSFAGYESNAVFAQGLG